MTFFSIQTESRKVEQRGRTLDTPEPNDKKYNLLEHSADMPRKTKLKLDLFLYLYQLTNNDLTDFFSVKHFDSKTLSVYSIVNEDINFLLKCRVVHFAASGGGL